MNSKALASFTLLGVLASLFVGCGDGDGTSIEICAPRAVSCLSDRGGYLCTSDGTARLSFDCEEGEVCRTDTSGKPGCAAQCEPGEKECASRAISRVCSNDGKTWIPIECEPGTGCDANQGTEGQPNPAYGSCVRTDDPVTVCTPERTACADDRTMKACEQDGSNWIYTACAEDELCLEGACTLDPAKECTPNMGSCVDATHVRKCAASGETYDPPQACPGQTRCSDGACRGSVCTVDEIRCDDVRDGNVWSALTQGTYQPRAVYRCEDGESWEVTECAQNQVCAYTNISSTAVNQYIEDLKTSFENDTSHPVFEVPESSQATCETPQCAAPFALRELLSDGLYEGFFFGSFACGDPTSDDPEFGGSFSLCEGLPPYNNLHWANYTCPEHTQCSYQTETLTTGSAQVPVCTSTCTNGDVKCFDPEGESTIQCVDGEWALDTVTPCRDGSREQWCRRNLTGANFTQATCQDPACAIWQDEFETFVVPAGYGACGDDGKFYQCSADGTMTTPGVDCPSCVRSIIRSPGVEVPAQVPSYFAGYQPGYCLAECSDTEQQCISIESSPPSPFYYECNGGHWTNVASCPNGQACHDYPRTAETLRRIICGGVCIPGQTSCVDEEGVLGGKFISTCNGVGAWGAPVECATGACTEDHQQAAGNASCEDECIPDTKNCSSPIAEIRCDESARYGDPVPCDPGTACFEGDARLAHLGCIDCVPFDPNHPSSIPDSRCAGDDLQVCGPNGTWATSRSTTCPQDCVGSQAGSTVPGESRAQCSPSAGGGGMSGSGPGGAGGGGLSGGGAGGLGGLG
jgi:hypothetical protein